MSTRPGPNRTRTALAVAGLALLPVLCCALPLLIAAGALGVLGVVLVNPWMIGGAVLLLLVAVVWAARRAGGSTRDDSGCPPVPSVGHQADRTRQPSIRRTSLAIARSTELCLTSPPRPLVALRRAAC
uniref:Uncharacterized protein n=1 Tax=Mycobacterium riyadhense TaxID=486698 RepID=A0A653EYD8_9MYCO|nr:hypothetical protein BIN_B_04565 [Mycobacterium riyadhense]